MKSELLNGLRCYNPSSKGELIDFAFQRKGILVAVNAEKILHAPTELVELVNNNIGYPDGIGAVWAIRQKGDDSVVKIPGVELWLEIIAKHYKNKAFYLVGGKEEVINETVKKLKEEFTGINIAGYRNGYIKTDEERKKLKEDIISKKPDVVFVAMGSPVQEYLMNELNAVHPAVYQGLGGSFDVYTGNVERAPDWWVNNNLEWAYRLVKEPKRIKRQLHLVRFFWNLKRGKY